MNKTILLLAGFLLFGTWAFSQVSNVEFGKNRVQYQKFQWKYYQTENFNTYFSQDGLGLGQYVAQIAEKELPTLEEFIEYGLQRRINIVAYNNFDEMQQSNIGIGIDWQNTGGITKFVNNKLLVYFDGNHDNLRRSVRQGIAQVLVQNVLFGDDLGEYATNQALLDLPKWLTDGYIEYAAEPWSTKLDDDLRATMLSAKYNNFYQFAFDKPNLAGHAFWKYIADKYGKNKVTYMLYLSRIYKNLNDASRKVTNKKFKTLLKDFMLDVPQQYYKDIKGRRNAPKGKLAVTEVVGKKDYIRFNANPNPKSFTYAYVEYSKGIYSVVLMENFVNRKVLVKYGTRSREDEMNPNYPILAWDGKGQRLAVMYSKEGKLNLMVYDVAGHFKPTQQELPMFDQVQDMKYMLDINTLLLSAIRSGQSDIYVYKIDKKSYEQVTNDVYDDLDAAFTAFPNKTGIVFSSNRPTANAESSPDSLPGKQFNIYLIDNWNKTDYKQISKLTDLKYGNARYPSQYNTTHFTFISDENGIHNRYAGFFKTERAGLDTLVFIGDEVLHNPQVEIVDSLLKEWGKTDVDSIGFVSVTNDSTYIFPLTNYQSSTLETRTAGAQQEVSEVVKLGDVKLLYRLKVDENTLRRRNVIARPTEYRRQIIDDDRKARNKQLVDAEVIKTDSTSTQNDFFQSEFEQEKKSDKSAAQLANSEASLLKKSKVYEYRPPKFFVDYSVTGFNNSVLPVNKYQQYGNGAGPIYLSNGNDFNGLIRMATSDLMEDYKFSGGLRIAPNFKDNDVLFEFYNMRKRLDWGLTYYRSKASVSFSGTGYTGKSLTTYYLGRLRYAFDRVRSIRASFGPRYDKLIVDGLDSFSLKAPDMKATYANVLLEYVHDNTITPATNIWHGLRYKVYVEEMAEMKNTATNTGKFIFNAGFDARHYLPLYRNVIWAVRAAGDFSWGEQKVVYYLGGVDNWFSPKFVEGNIPVQNYAFQSLAVNMRGYKQNVAHGNNAVIINSEVRAPVFASLLNKPINNAFLRNFQLVQFLDLGTAWEGEIKNIKRPQTIYIDQNVQNPIPVSLITGGIGPFAGGYGFGARSTLLGYFVRFDAAWDMSRFFYGKPRYYFALGLDF